MILDLNNFFLNFRVYIKLIETITLLKKALTLLLQLSCLFFTSLTDNPEPDERPLSYEHIIICLTHKFIYEYVRIVHRQQRLRGRLKEKSLRVKRMRGKKLKLKRDKKKKNITKYM